MQSMFRKIASLFIVLGTLTVPLVCQANSINMHESPSDQAKVTGSIDLSAGIIPIYTPANSQWIKVADPRNGNTGWVKNSDLKDSKGNLITFKQQVSDNGNGQSVQIMQTSGQPLSPEQKKTMDQQLQLQGKAAQESIMKLQQSTMQMMDEVKKLYQQQYQIMQQAGIPVTLPGMQNQQATSPATSVPAQQPVMMPGQQAYPPPPPSGMQPMQNQSAYPPPAMQQGQATPGVMTPGQMQQPSMQRPAGS